MGRKGPLPDPKSERTAKGWNTSKKQAKRKMVPVRMPVELSKNKPAAAFWKQLAPSLIADGRLTTDRVHSFAMLCRLHSLAAKLEAQLEKEGHTISTDRGPAANPLDRQARSARVDFVALARDFGLTAASAARLPEIDDDEEEDPLGEFA